MMGNFLDPPARVAGELRFRLGDIPVRVQPWFWVVTVIMAANRQDPGAVLSWVGVVFFSILIHELGHVVAFRSFGIRAEAVLYAWGGLAVPERTYNRGPMAQVIISLAGPFAGFVVAAITAAVAFAIGAKVHLGLTMFVIPTISAWPESLHSVRLYYWFLVLNDLLWVNFYWGLMNLLPVYPLDGGQAARALFEHSDPVRGRRRSIIVSAAVGAAIAIIGLIGRETYLVWMFGILAAGSFQLLESNRPMFRPGTYRR